MANSESSSPVVLVSGASSGITCFLVANSCFSDSGRSPVISESQGTARSHHSIDIKKPRAVAGLHLNFGLI
jgi:hypothetical protein